MEEAISRKCNLIVAHHPIIFAGLKKITGRNYVERTVILAIRHDIAIYAIHTNLDNVLEGVNGRMAGKLGLLNCRPLLPRGGTLLKLFCFVPTDHLDRVREAVWAAGAGHIGHYGEASFNTDGVGTFTGGCGYESLFWVSPGVREEVRETRMEVILPAHLRGQVVEAMTRAHPYAEVAYDLVGLDNKDRGVGSGLIGELPAAVGEESFLARIKEAFRLSVVRHTPLTGRPVKTCALCGGAGSFLISNALAAGANFYITSDVKYHEFFDADGRLVIADIGHYESEQFTIDLLFEVLREKFPSFAVLKSGLITNPVKYY